MYPNSREHVKNWIRKSTRFAIYHRDNFTCVYCRRDLINAENYARQLDHIIPVCKGGTNDPSNLVTCCKICNNLKNGSELQFFALTERCKGTQKQVLDRVAYRTSLALNRAVGRLVALGELSMSRRAINKYLRGQR